MNIKFGVKVPLFTNEYLWVTQGDSKFHLEPMLFDSKEAAEEYALTVWGEDAIVSEYTEDLDESQGI
jgi:hypothetical protein